MKRLEALENFKQGYTRVLVSTDVMGRGLDITSITHVVIYEMPGSVEDYVHRIGRPSRSEGATGHALTFFEYWRGAPLLAKELCALLAQAGQRVPAELVQLAEDVAAGKYDEEEAWDR